MSRTTGMNIHDWQDLEASVLSRMREYNIPESELRAVKIEWPEGTHGVSEAVPSCVRLVIRGLRAQGFVIPEGAVQVIEGTCVHGHQLVEIYPQRPGWRVNTRTTRGGAFVPAYVPSLSTK